MKFKPPLFLTLLEEETDLEFQITPMIDLLLVLLIFFMAIIITKILQNEASLQLPQLSENTLNSKKTITSGQCVINIAWQTSWTKPLLTVDQTPIPSLSQLSTLMVRNQKAFQKLHPQKKFRVFIRADRKLPYHFLQEILRLCEQNGLHDVAFATTTP